MRSLSLALIVALSACSPYQWKLRETNDYFTFFNDDHGYTQGLELSANDGRTTIGIGQDIYTPEHKRERIPRRDERPYAGYVYAFWERVDGDYSYTLRPGWIGPLARGKETQCTFHMAIGQDCPAGWPEQISDRPALEASLRREWRYGGNTYGIGADLGSPKTRIYAESRIRWLEVASDVELYAGPRLEIIAHDELLEASTSTVRKRPYRASIRTGLRWGAVDYFLATETSAIKESGDAYNYGGLEFVW